MSLQSEAPVARSGNSRSLNTLDTVVVLGSTRHRLTWKVARELDQRRKRELTITDGNRGSQGWESCGYSTRSPECESLPLPKRALLLALRPGASAWHRARVLHLRLLLQSRPPPHIVHSPAQR